jgi:isopentenyl-diphosphate delta-isomerase
MPKSGRGAALSNYGGRLVSDDVVLVDENDRRLGVAEKLSAHLNGGRLHRAISIFVFNSAGQIMLQQRADGKYHSASLWSNTCCSHPRDGEAILDAAHRRLREEMGFDCHLKEAFTLIYKLVVGNGFTEHELNHVLFGIYNGQPKLNPEEAKSWKWIWVEALATDVKRNGEAYSEWLKLLLGGISRPRIQQCLGSAVRFVRRPPRALRPLHDLRP